MATENPNETALCDYDEAEDMTTNDVILQEGENPDAVKFEIHCFL